MEPESPIIAPQRLSTGHYLNLPNLMSATRLPLAIAFGATLDRPTVALPILATAALSDMLDGMLARRHHQASRLGGIIDPIFDKLFVVIAVIALIFSGRLTLLEFCLVITRDVLMVPLMGALAWSSSRTRAAVTLKSNRYGKATTVVQFSALIAAILVPGLVFPLATASAAMGVVCILSYSMRAWRERAANV